MKRIYMSRAGVSLRASDTPPGSGKLRGSHTEFKDIYGDMREWLLMQKAEHDQEWPDCPLVFHYLGRPIGSHIKGWDRACTARRTRGPALPRLAALGRAHMERAGIPRKIAMSISGHKRESVYRRYDIVSPQDFADRRFRSLSDRRIWRRASAGWCRGRGTSSACSRRWPRRSARIWPAARLSWMGRACVPGRMAGRYFMS